MVHFTESAARPAGRMLVLTGVLTGLYMAQSVVSGIVNSALPVILRDAGLGLDQIGLTSLFILPWALKIFWAPLVDRYGSARGWILACQATLIACFLIAALVDPGTFALWLLPLIILLVFASATQDIATDAAGIHATNPETRTIASGASTMGGYAGYLIGGGLWLWVYAVHGWQPAMLLLALIVAVLSLPSLIAGSVLQTPAANPSAKLRSALADPRLRRGLLMLAGWNGAVRLTLTVSGTMLVDAGLKLEEIAWVRGTGAMLVGLLAAIAATALAQRIGLRNLLITAAALFVLGGLGHLIWLGGLLGSANTLIALHLAYSLAISVSFVAVYALMIEYCEPSRAATDFAVLQSFDVLLLVGAGLISGLIAEHFGYASVFALAIILMIFTAPLVLRHAPRFGTLSQMQTPQE